MESPLQEESQLAKISRDSSKIIVEQLHGLMSQVKSGSPIQFLFPMSTLKNDTVEIMLEFNAYVREIIEQGDRVDTLLLE